MSRRYRRRRTSAPFDSAASHQTFREAPGVEFERYVAERFRSLGWQATVTRATGDGGVDVICLSGTSKLVVQCKHWTNAVGHSAVQEIHTAKYLQEAGQAAVVTTSSFTKAAQSSAAKLGVLLLHIDHLHPGCALDRSTEYEIQQKNLLREKFLKEQNRIIILWKNYDADLYKYQEIIDNRPRLILSILITAAVVSVPAIQCFRAFPLLTCLTLALAGGIAAALLEPRLKPPRPTPPPHARIHPAGSKRVVACIHCAGLLRLPAGRAGRVTCPACGAAAWYET